MFNKILKKILVVLILLTGFYLSNSHLAESFGRKNTVVLFCANWNVECRRTSATLDRIVNKDYANKVDFLNLDVDNPDTPDKAKSLNINVPYQVPYLFILDNKNNVVLKKYCAKETYESLKQLIEGHLE